MEFNVHIMMMSQDVSENIHTVKGVLSQFKQSDYYKNWSPREFVLVLQIK